MVGIEHSSLFTNGTVPVVEKHAFALLIKLLVCFFYPNCFIVVFFLTVNFESLYSLMIRNIGLQTLPVEDQVVNILAF